MSCFPLLLIWILVQQPPEPSKACQELARKLEERLRAVGTLTAKIVMESIDGEGVKVPAIEIEAHFRFAEGWMYMAGRKIESDGRAEEFCSWHDGKGAMFTWRPGEGAIRVDSKGVWRYTYDLDEELDRLLDSPPEFKSFEEWVAAMKPAWLLDIDPDSTGSGSNFRFAVAMGREFAVSWLDGLRKAKDGDIAEEKDEVTARFPSLGKTIVIDRNTGFLRSIRNDLKSGGARLLTIREAKTGTPKPEIRLPGTVNERKLSSEEIAAAAAGGLSGHLAVALRRILERWEKVGAPERAESLRCFFSTMAARRDASIRRSSYQRWTTAFLESALGHGKSLDQLGSDLEAKSAELQEYLHRGEDRYRDRFAEFNGNFKNQVLKLASESSGSEQGKRALATRINEGFDPDRVEKARANLGAPDYKALLKQAIEEARAKK